MPEQKVLVIEDEENLLEALRYSLEREGFAVLTATDGESGLQLAREGAPDLVLLDVMLPRLDGLEICRILRRETQTPILMLTAKGEEIDKVVGLELGADDYVTKPFSMRELLGQGPRDATALRYGPAALGGGRRQHRCQGGRHRDRPHGPHREGGGQSRWTSNRGSSSCWLCWCPTRGARSRETRSSSGSGGTTTSGTAARWTYTCDG